MPPPTLGQLAALIVYATVAISAMLAGHLHKPYSRALDVAWLAVVLYYPFYVKREVRRTRRRSD